MNYLDEIKRVTKKALPRKRPDNSVRFERIVLTTTTRRKEVHSTEVRFNSRRDMGRLVKALLTSAISTDFNRLETSVLNAPGLHITIDHQNLPEGDEA